MIIRASALPLSLDASSRLLPWLIAFMVWLATLALATYLVISAASEQWRRGLTGSVTVQIVPTKDADDTLVKQRVNRVLAILQASPSVKAAKQLSEVKISQLLEPWLGLGSISGPLRLPIPQLIDVTLTPTDDGSPHNTSLLATHIMAEVPGATLDDHGEWLNRLLHLAWAVEIVAIILLTLTGFAAVATIIFATRTSLAIHYEVIELLHLMGAPDSYIARQFQLNAIRLGLKGGVAGVLFAVFTLLVLGWFGGKFDAGLLVLPPLTPTHWISLTSVFLIAALISLLTARITVLRFIGRMP